MTSYLPRHDCTAGGRNLPLAAGGGRGGPVAQRPHGSQRCPQHEGMGWPTGRNWVDGMVRDAEEKELGKVPGELRRPGGLGTSGMRTGVGSRSARASRAIHALYRLQHTGDGIFTETQYCKKKMAVKSISPAIRITCSKLLLYCLLYTEPLAASRSPPPTAWRLQYLECKTNINRKRY
jgi:hypothetical protein